MTQSMMPAPRPRQDDDYIEQMPSLCRHYKARKPGANTILNRKSAPKLFQGIAREAQPQHKPKNNHYGEQSKCKFNSSGIIPNNDYLDW